MYVYYERMRVVFIHIMHTREYYAYELVLASTRVLYIILTIYFNMRTNYSRVASMHTRNSIEVYLHYSDDLGSQ